MATTERTMTVDLRKDFVDTPLYKRAKKAVTIVREFLQQHMKSDNVKLGKYLNLKIWEHGIKNPIQRITVVAKKDDKGVVTAELPSIPVKKQKPAKEKKGKTAKEGGEKGKAEPKGDKKAADEISTVTAAATATDATQKTEAKV